MNPQRAAYLLGYDYGQATVTEARDLFEQRAERREKGGETGARASDASHGIIAVSRLIRRSIHRSRKAMANAQLRGDRNTAAYHFGYIDGLRSVVL